MFVMFSLSHLTTCIFGFFLLLLLIFTRRRLRGERVQRTFRLFMGWFLLASEVALQISQLVDGTWDAFALPFQLCSLTLLLSAYNLLTESRRFNAVVVFLGTMGALQAVLTPALDYGFPHFRYFLFFLSHFGILATAVYLAAVQKYKPSIRDMLLSLLWLHILAIPAAVTNWLTGWTNFMFLARKPASASLLDLLAPWPWYLLQLEVVALVLCFTLYLLLQFAFWLAGKTGSLRSKLLQ